MISLKVGENNSFSSSLPGQEEKQQRFMGDPAMRSTCVRLQGSKEYRGRWVASPEMFFPIYLNGGMQFVLTFLSAPGIGSPPAGRHWRYPVEERKRAWSQTTGSHKPTDETAVERYAWISCLPLYLVASHGMMCKTVADDLSGLNGPIQSNVPCKECQRNKYSLALKTTL